ncbi:MAG: serine/threonine protein kinase, partial [Holophaga sp.]|nr:serine/threonine protein kinase [Holophaga sp.]
RAAIAWWASWLEGEAPVTLAGVSVLRFDGRGRVVEHLDLWNDREGRHPPFQRLRALENPSQSPMFSSRLAYRILSEARSRGLLAEPSESDAHPRGETLDKGAAGYWGEHLASLVASGRIAQGVLDSLAWDAVSQVEAEGSWVDPLFRGPAAIGDLPGMGDRYRDLVPLGEGATARVYRAMDTLLQRPVAIKVLKDPGGPSLAEARAQAQVEHANVCRIYEVGKGFLVMALVDGPTLARLAPDLGRDAKLRILRDVALGVHAAHQKGLLHLDLKLNNILMETHEDGSLHPTVSDFGMVRGNVPDATQNCPMGTPPYTSPEQLAGDTARLGKATDVYALGVMLYVLLAGCSPFDAKDFQGLLDAMAAGSHIPLRRRLPKLPRDLERIVKRCMEKEPANRYATARDLAEDLDRFLRTEPVLAMGSGRFYRIGKWVRRNPKVQWLGALSLVLLALTMVIMARHSAFLSQQAEWDHHFLRIVEELRGERDRIYRLPPHDIDPEMAKAKEVLASLEAARIQGGKAAEGPGYLALGQAHHLLDPREAEAVKCFQKAWDLGYRTESVRAWLALTLVDRYQAVARQEIAFLQPGEAQRADQEARQRYLVPARAMLKGRGSPEQARLAHLVELAEAASEGNLGDDRRIRMAQDYRARFPNDLDALFEEAAALMDKADLMAHRAGLGSPVYPPRCSGEVEPVREEAKAILLKLRQIAPSHPKVYATLADFAQRQYHYPTDRTSRPTALLDQCRGWLDEGSNVSRTDQEVLASRATYLGSMAIDFELRRGLPVGPTIRALQDLIHQAARASGSRAYQTSLYQMHNCVQACNAYGLDTTPAIVETAFELLDHGRAGEDRIALASAGLASLQLLETGGDPGPLVQVALQKIQAADLPGTAQGIILELTRAEHANLTGRDARPFLDRAQALLGTFNPQTMFRWYFWTSIALERALSTQRAEDWEALEGSLRQRDELAKGNPGVWIQASVWRAREALLRHRQDAGEDIGPALASALQALEATEANQGSGLPTWFTQRATLRLLQARQSGDPLPLLRMGLEDVEAAFVHMRPMSKAEIRADAWSRPGLSHGAARRPGRILKLKGELLLAMARIQPLPSARARTARQALACFSQSSAFNANLERGLQPLREEARAIAQEPALQP